MKGIITLPCGGNLICKTGAKMARVTQPPRSYSTHGLKAHADATSKAAIHAADPIVLGITLLRLEAYEGKEPGIPSGSPHLPTFDVMLSGGNQHIEIVRHFCLFAIALEATVGDGRLHEGRLRKVPYDQVPRLVTGIGSCQAPEAADPIFLIKPDQINLARGTKGKACQLDEKRMPRMVLEGSERR